MAVGDWTHDFLSTSTDGAGVLIASTSSATPTTLHTCVAGTKQIDYVTMYASNKSADTANQIFLRKGASGTYIALDIAPNDTRVILESSPGNNSLVIAAYAGTANEVVIDGRVKTLVTDE